MKGVISFILIFLLCTFVSAISLSPNSPSSSPLTSTINDGLIAYWSFDVDARDDWNGDDNGVVIDAIHNNATAYLNGSAVSGGSYTFTQPSSLIIVDTPRMRTNSDFSISGWYKGEGGALFAATETYTRAADPVNWYIMKNADTLSANISCNISNMNLLETYQPRTYPNWSHVVLTYDKDGEVKLYLNSVLKVNQTSNTSNCSIVPSGNDAIFSRDRALSRHFYGSLDEWRYYNRTLNQSEITALYQQNSTITPGLCGDVNLDTRVDVLDALIVARYSSGLIPFTPNQIACGDVNYMTILRVDILDALLIARKSVGQPVTLSCSSLC